MIAAATMVWLLVGRARAEQTRTIDLAVALAAIGSVADAVLAR